MTTAKKTPVAIAGFMVVLGVGIVVAFAVPLARAAATSAANAVVPAASSTSATAVLPEGGPPRPPAIGLGTDVDSYLARALGITVDQLRAARAKSAPGSPAAGRQRRRHHPGAGR